MTVESTRMIGKKRQDGMVRKDLTGPRNKDELHSELWMKTAAADTSPESERSVG